jgi:hypothetical protein
MSTCNTLLTISFKIMLVYLVLEILLRIVSIKALFCSEVTMPMLVKGVPDYLHAAAASPTSSFDQQRIKVLALLDL